eukprot:2527607-Alexandrium_andersonii.AAC.1
MGAGGRVGSVGRVVGAHAGRGGGWGLRSKTASARLGAPILRGSEAQIRRVPALKGGAPCRTDE